MILARYFFYGILAAFGALFLELLSGMIIKNFTFFVILSALIEEIFIFIFIYKSLQESPDSSRKEFFLYFILIGLGFSFLELLLNFFNLAEGKNALYFQSATVLNFAEIVLVHLLTACLMGYLIIKSRTLSLLAIAQTLVPAFLLHLAYNFFMIYNIL